MKKILNNPVFWIVIFSIFPLLSLLSQGMPFVHDGQDHVARIANFYQSLSEGNFIPRWAANLDWGYGHPILMFLYPLPSYLASFFHFIGYSLVDSTKLVFAVSFIVSGLTMYLWLSASWGKRVGYIGSMLYMFAPYRFVDLYVRGAIGEHVAFIFPPLILYFIYKLGRKSHLWYGIGLSVSLAGLLLAHNAITLMFVPIIGLYGLYVLVFESKKKLLFISYSILFILLGFGLSAFFWFPAYFEGKYTLRDIVATSEVITTFVPWRWFLYSPWNYGGGQAFTKSFGFIQWFGILASVYVIWKSKDRKEKTFLILFCLFLCASVFIMSPPSTFIWLKIRTLQKFQFTWRFLSVSVFVSAVLGAIGISSVCSYLKSKIKYPKFILLFLITYCLLLIASTTTMWHPKGYQIKADNFYTGIYPGTTDTGESTPIWSVRFMEHTAKAPAEVISGDSVITPVKRTTTLREYQINTITPSRILENTLYFPGWKVYVDGIIADVQFQDPYFRGLMTFRLTEGAHRVRIVFENTRLREVANLTSAISFGIITLLIFGSCIWRRKK